MASRYESWGRFPRSRQSVVRYEWRHEPPCLPEPSDSYLPYGNGRSYGDVCLNDGGTLLDCRPLNRFLSFDEETGVLRCEAGVLLAEILEVFVPKGWFLPVTPGTQFATIGGAIANDVHGKNHHCAGTFGMHVRRFELLRSDGERMLCSPDENGDWFRATIGGLGLTGAITWAELALKPVSGAAIEQETTRYRDLTEFFELSEASASNEYTVAWVDCAAGKKSLGRGLFMRGEHAARNERILRPPRRLAFPVDPPVSLVNGLGVRVFNELYYRKQWRRTRRARCHYESFFYPLDAVRSWNRIYGRRGFFQYQCVVPPAVGHGATQELLEKISRAGVGSFLAVLKVFGDCQSPGWLSFPRPGVTLALDFPNRGQSTLHLLNSLDETVAAAGGAVNPSKDARMSGERFRQYFPNWAKMQQFRDERISSGFWRRVAEEQE